MYSFVVLTFYFLLTEIVRMKSIVCDKFVFVCVSMDRSLIFYFKFMWLFVGKE